MRITLGPAFLAVVLTTAALPKAAGAQGSGVPGVARPFVAIAHRDLRFVRVLPGIPESVHRHDPRDSGLFEIQGTANGAVRIEFLLPHTLVASFGAHLPIDFGPGDGFADLSRGRPPRGHVFDPHAPLVAALGPNGRLWIRLGGAVNPARDQAGGTYSAIISITVFDLGS
jgi:hypothetical protein